MWICQVISVESLRVLKLFQHILPILKLFQFFPIGKKITHWNEQNYLKTRL